MISKNIEGRGYNSLSPLLCSPCLLENTLPKPEAKDRFCHGLLHVRF